VNTRDRETVQERCNTGSGTHTGTRSCRETADSTKTTRNTARKTARRLVDSPLLTQGTRRQFKKGVTQAQEHTQVQGAVDETVQSVQTQKEHSQKTARRLVDSPLEHRQ
jgi:hypothetical protein